MTFFRVAFVVIVLLALAEIVANCFIDWSASPVFRVTFLYALNHCLWGTIALTTLTWFILQLISSVFPQQPQREVAGQMVTQATQIH